MATGNIKRFQNQGRSYNVHKTSQGIVSGWYYQVFQGVNPNPIRLYTVPDDHIFKLYFLEINIPIPLSPQNIDFYVGIYDDGGGTDYDILLSTGGTNKLVYNFSHPLIFTRSIYLTGWDVSATDGNNGHLNINFIGKEV